MKFPARKTTNKDIISKIIKEPTDIYGLSFYPSLEPNWSKEDGWLSPPNNLLPSSHFTKMNHEVLKSEILKQNNPSLIVEIGVDSTKGKTSTNTILETKLDSTKYIGVDTRNMEYLNNSDKNIFTLSTTLNDFIGFENKMKEIGESEIDFMFVDGPKTMVCLLDEWEYWKWMKSDGVMVFHDIHYHPNCVALFEAIDRDIFDVTMYGIGEKDFGMGVVKRKR